MELHKTPFVIQSVSDEGCVVFCGSVNSTARDSSLALRMTGALDGASTKTRKAKTPIVIQSVSDESLSSICNARITDFTSFIGSTEMVFCGLSNSSSLEKDSSLTLRMAQAWMSTQSKKIGTARK